MRRKNEIIYDYAEFSGIPIPSLNQQLNQFHQLINQEWHAIDSSNWNEITRQFYAQSEHYILDLLCANPDRMEIERKLEEYQVWQFFASSQLKGAASKRSKFFIVRSEGKKRILELFHLKLHNLMEEVFSQYSE